MTSSIRYLSGCVAVVALGGCATLSPDGGLARVEQLARERDVDVALARVADEAETRTRLALLLKEPLAPEAAVEVALLNNAGFRARVAQLAVADADRVQATRLANPSLSFSDKR